MNAEKGWALVPRGDAPGLREAVERVMAGEVVREPRPAEGSRMRIGGLLRCCIESTQRYEGPMIAGQTAIPCLYHDTDTPNIRIADDGVWEWVGPAPIGRKDGQ
jgi:hypothetical protein